MADIDGIKPPKPIEESAGDDAQTQKTDTNGPSTLPAPNEVSRQVISEPQPLVETADPSSEDATVDAAVDDIVKKDSDSLLAAKDNAKNGIVTMKQSRWDRYKIYIASWWANPRKRWGAMTALIIIVAVLFAVPVTRYNILGVALKAPVSVKVIDSKTGAPVSGAMVELSGKKAETQADGKVTLRVKLGSGSLKTGKKYYSTSQQGKLVAFSGNNFTTSLVALGHQVRIKIIDKISGKPLSSAAITAGGAKTKTDMNGMATVVTPSSANMQPATVSITGYNTANISIDTSGAVSKNTFSITPAGKLYFLSNLSGRIDVVKTNLDGSDRQTVLAGTGSEERGSTSLLASRDWKYLALLSKRSGTNASIYLIDTTQNDKLTTIDQGNANFNLVGWSDDRFIYTVDRSPTVSSWQANQYALKSLDATTGQTLVLDQTQATGTDINNFAGQNIGSPYIIDGQVVYAKNWNGSYNNQSLMDGKQAELDSIGADGSSHKVIKSFSSATPTSYVSVTTQLYEPDGLYVYFPQAAVGNQFYVYDNGKITADTVMTSDTFYQTPYPTYLLSPSGQSSFWSEQRDGKNTLFTGDADGKNQKQIASLSDYNAYGWYTDNYLLVSKNSSELYIMPSSGGTPFKITDYYKPAINYQGYGGGYGGL